MSYAFLRLNSFKTSSGRRVVCTRGGEGVMRCAVMTTTFLLSAIIQLIASVTDGYLRLGCRLGPVSRSLDAHRVPCSAATDTTMLPSRPLDTVTVVYLAPRKKTERDICLVGVQPSSGPLVQRRSPPSHLLLVLPVEGEEGHQDDARVGDDVHVPGAPADDHQAAGDLEVGELRTAEQTQPARGSKNGVVSKRPQE